MRNIQVYKIINNKGNYFLLELLSDNPKDERPLFCIGLSSETNNLSDSQLSTCRKINNNKLTFLNMLFSENYSIEKSTSLEKEIILKKLLEFKEKLEDDSFNNLYDEMNNISNHEEKQKDDIDIIDKEFYEELSKKLGN